jgi:hypothetical protein
MNKKLVVSLVALFLASNYKSRAQLVDEQNVTITMDLQPILQLEMSGPQNIDFIFDEVHEYVGGITKYGVTQLKVSASVDWDLYAVGYSSGNTNANPLLMDNQVTYGTAAPTNASNRLDCELLELRQDKANPGTTAVAANFNDYSSPFVKSVVNTGANNIYTSVNPYTKPAVGLKYIAGGNAGADFIAGGTYLVLNGGNVGAGSNYWYTIDYRIVPGLPAIFPNTYSNAGVASAIHLGGVATNYAQPGVYTMNVKYVLVQN